MNVVTLAANRLICDARPPRAECARRQLTVPSVT